MKKYLFSFALMLMAQGALACTPGVGGGPHGDPLCMGGVFEQQRLMQQQQSYSGGYDDTSSGYAPVEYWGAVASNVKTAVIFSSTQQLSEEAAISDALKKCGEKDCTIKITYKNMYVAGASGPTEIGTYSVSYVGGYSQREAELGAIELCKNLAKDCRVFMVDKAFP